MLKASELRIGNFVKVNNPEFMPQLEDIILEIVGIRKCLKCEGIENSGYSIELVDRKNYNHPYSQFICFIEPIEVTSNMLVMFGFVNGEKENFSFTKNMQLRIIGSESDYNGIWHGKVFCHQLQNMYLDFVGNDLGF